MAWRRKLARLGAEVHNGFDLILLARIASLAIGLPVLLRVMSLSTLMQIWTPARTRRRARAFDADRMARLTDLVLARLPLARNTCLIRSLVLYRLLRTGGMPARIHFGVRQAGRKLTGHSWLTCEGQPLSESPANTAFSEIHSYPPDTGELTGEQVEEQSVCAWPG
jgi:hypothetical protein